ncbi:MAG: hypothetical protein K1X75_14305 [Leptospirales bacterium]|nr:hypothetical protein [Leptospirales bacterium]
MPGRLALVGALALLGAGPATMPAAAEPAAAASAQNSAPTIPLFYRIPRGAWLQEDGGLYLQVEADNVLLARQYGTSGAQAIQLSVKQQVRGEYWACVESVAPREFKADREKPTPLQARLDWVDAGECLILNFMPNRRLQLTALPESAAAWTVSFLPPGMLRAAAERPLPPAPPPEDQSKPAVPAASDAGAEAGGTRPPHTGRETPITAQPNPDPTAEKPAAEKPARGQ